jgi:hypothetical protein
MNEHSLLWKYFLCGILASSSCGGAIKAVDKLLVLIGGIATIVGGIFVVIFSWFSPVLVGTVAGVIAIVWGILASIAYFF